MKLNYNKKYFLISTIILTIVIVLSTIAHHVFPWIMRVPDVIGPYTIEPIWIDLLTLDLGSLIISILVFYHSVKADGLLKAVSFLYGSIIFTGLEECFWILSGRFGLIPFETYFFTKGGMWFIEIPVFTCLGWYIIAWCSFYISRIIFTKKGYLFHASIAGIFAVSFDFFIDPVMVNLGSTSIYKNAAGLWVWLTDPAQCFRIFSIPFYNFVGWFLVISIYALLYEYALDTKRIERIGKTKAILEFYGLMPIFLAITVGLIMVAFFATTPLFGINLMPIPP
ncbi:MAG: carotenoid biosynthesis protein [Candidatus Helarchaeota archaeon]